MLKREMERNRIALSRGDFLRAIGAFGLAKAIEQVTPSIVNASQEQEDEIDQAAKAHNLAESMEFARRDFFAQRKNPESLRKTIIEGAQILERRGNKVERSSDIVTTSQNKITIGEVEYNILGTTERVIVEALIEANLRIKGIQPSKRFSQGAVKYRQRLYYQMDEAKKLKGLIEFVDGKDAVSLGSFELSEMATLLSMLKDQGKLYPKKWADYFGGSLGYSGDTFYFHSGSPVRYLGWYVLPIDQKYFADYNKSLDEARKGIDINTIRLANPDLQRELANKRPEDEFADSYVKFLTNGQSFRNMILKAELIKDKGAESFLRAQYEAHRRNLGFETLISGKLWKDPQFSVGQVVEVNEYDMQDAQGFGEKVCFKPKPTGEIDPNWSFLYDGTQLRVLSERELVDRGKYEAYYMRQLQRGDIKDGVWVPYEIGGSEVRGWMPEQYLRPVL